MQSMIDMILADGNLEEAIRAVCENKGAPGVDGMSVRELDDYFRKYKWVIRTLILEKRYKPQPVRRVYIPKPNSDKKRPLGIPTAVDRVIQKAISNILVPIYERIFSEYSYGYRPNRSAHGAMNQALAYLNEGRTVVVDFDIEKFFDTVNHDKLISILREQVNDSITLHLIRSFLKAGIMEDGLVSPCEDGVPQGGPLSCVLSNIYLDKLDKELERRGLAFVRYADDFCIYVQSEKAAERVMASVSSWIERKLFLKVSASKTKIVPPTKSEYLGFGFWKSRNGWKCRPLESRKDRLREKIKKATIRKVAAALPISVTVTKVNQIIRGWINYYGIGSMKGFLEEFGSWMRHRIRVVMIKQWKKPMTVIRKLKWYCNQYHLSFTNVDLWKIGFSSRGLYARCNGDIINFILSPDILEKPIEVNGKKVFPGLVNPVKFYLEKACNS